MEDLTLDDLYMEYHTSYFPPTQRRRVEKQLKYARKLRSNNLSPLEVTKEKFEQEAHILNKTVIVDDGAERKVYSTCVFEGAKRYNCNVCVVAIFGKTSLICHNRSKKHYYMMLRKTHPHQNFDEHQIINLDQRMKRISMSDAYITADVLDKCPDYILIGLEYLVEVHDPRKPYCYCLLCNKSSSDVCNTMDHLQSIEHMMFYLLLFFPKVYKKLLLLKRHIRMKQLVLVVEKIQRKYGRLKPWRHEGALSLKQKRAIRYSIDSGTHIRDNVDLSFAEDIVFNEKVKNKRIHDTVITEFVVNETEEGVTEFYERLKGGIYRCRLCRLVVESPIEKITHPYTGMHLEKTFKGIAIYESVRCQIQSVFDNFGQPLIGTEYVVEYDEQGVFQYHCMLCVKAMNHIAMVTSHLVSKAHRQRYIKHHLPKRDEELLKQSGPVRANEIEKLIKLIEAKYGRLPPYGSLFALEHQVDSKTTVKDLISKKIMDGEHFTVDDRGRPKVIFGMPVPLFPKEGQDTSEGESKSKKKRKKKKQSSLSPSHKRRRSRSSSSSQSLSPVARQRGLSPEPGPSTSYLPQQEMPPPAFVRNWLKITSNLPKEIPPYDCDRKKIEDFFKTCDEKNWQKNDGHNCFPLLSAKNECPLREGLKNDELFCLIIREITFMWLMEELVSGRGWKLDELDMANPKFKTMVTIMEEGPICTEVCRPLCVNLVHSMIHCVMKEFPECKGLTDEEIKISCLGLINISNWVHLIWSVLNKSS